MKILIANKFYYPRGGDCIYTLNLQKMLENQGHSVAIFAMQYPLNLPSPWSRYWPSEMRTPNILTRPFGDAEVKRKFSALLNEFQPDVVHLNNIHTQLSPIIAELAHRRGIKVVWTLHDTKPVCPCYTCTRSGQWCEECFTAPSAVIRHRCMPGNLPGALVGYAELKKWNPSRLMGITDLFLPPSQFLADTLVRGGYRPEKLRVMCNFISPEKVENPSFKKDDYCIYIGRVNEVKGIRTLCKAIEQTDLRLIVVGDGELLPELSQRYSGNPRIDFRGQMQWEDFRPLLEGARFMVIPSEWSENNPLSVIESLSLGTPVLGARIGGIPELIEEGVNGLTFKSGDVADLRNALALMAKTPFNYPEIAGNASSRFSQDAYYQRLMDIYNS